MIKATPEPRKDSRGRDHPAGKGPSFECLRTLLRGAGPPLPSRPVAQRKSSGFTHRRSRVQILVGRPCDWDGGC